MKVFSFGDVIRNIRVDKGISQNTLIGIVDEVTNGEFGIDTVSICRWENGVVTPSHKRQVEFVNILGHDLHDCIDTDSLTMTQDEIREYLMNKIIVLNNWDFTSTETDFEQLEQQKIENNDFTQYLFTDRNTRIPIAHMAYQLENDTITRGEKYLVINSLYCVSADILIDLMSFLLGKLLKKQVSGIIYKSKYVNSPLAKFTKSVGFKCLNKRNEEYISVLSYADIIYRQDYFYLTACYASRVEE